MVRVYTNMKVIERKDPNMMDAYPFRIESVKFCSGAFDCGKTDGLFLQLKKAQDDKTYYYGLVGEKYCTSFDLGPDRNGTIPNLHEDFLNHMKTGKVEELVGKYVIGRVKEDSTALQDLIVDEN